jgi:hypothetical protein
MNEVDLHGMTHDEALILAEDYVLLNETPIKIITGNSLSLQDKVCDMLNYHKFNYRIGDFSGNNLGIIIVL